MARMRSSESQGPAWMVQAAQIARLFYLEGRSKVEIADELAISRFKVARILEESRDLGLVQVSIRLPASIDADLSTDLRNHLAGVRCIVADRDSLGEQEGSAAERRRAVLGELVADLLAELVEEDAVLGLTCSRTVSAATDALTRLAPCTVVQLTGTLAGAEAGATGSVEGVRRAAAIGGGTALPIYAPMLLPDAATARGLAQEPSIRRTLDACAEVTIAVVAVGGWVDGSSTVWEAASAEERAEAAEAGVVGEIGGMLFAAEGTPVDAPLRERVLGIDGERLRSIGEVIATAHGADRAEAVYAAVRGGLVNTVVCDDDLARALLALPPLESTPRTEAAS